MTRLWCDWAGGVACCYVFMLTPVAGSQIELSGRVTDLQGHAIKDAHVTLVAPANTDSVYVADLMSDRPSLHSATDPTGEFRIAFATDDRRFLQPGDFLLVVRAAGVRLHVEKLPMARLQVGVPMVVELKPDELVTVRVRTSEGQPVAGASIFAASVGGLRVPWSVARTGPAVVTNGEGRAALRGVTLSSLAAIFAISSETGNQRIALGNDLDGTLVATLVDAGRIQGQIRSRTGEEIFELDHTSLFITSKSVTEAFEPWDVDGPTQCSWDEAKVGATGAFAVNRIGYGRLDYQIICDDAFPYREPYSDVSRTLDSSNSPLPWRIEFVRQVKLIATTVDSATGQPLPNIYVSAFDQRLNPIFTDSEGQATFFRTIENVSYYPFDALGTFFSPDAFYTSSNKLPQQGEIALAPDRLAKSSAWTGRIVDEQEEPVAGATIRFAYSLERFNQTERAFSDSSGRFVLHRIADGTAVEMWARHGSRVSDRVTAVITSDLDLTLRLVPRVVARPAGRFVDSEGQPIANLPVTLKRAEVRKKEGWSREELEAVELYDVDRVVRTGNDGTFEFPETTEFGQRLQIQAIAPGYFPFYSPFIDGSQLSADATGQRLDLGTFQVMRHAPQRLLTVFIRDHEQKPARGAEVVVIGARTGTIRGRADGQGRVALDVARGNAILAVSCPGSQVHFSEVSPDNDSVEVTLAAESDVRETPEAASTWNVDRDVYRRAAERIFTMDRPEPDASSYARQTLYFRALAKVRPQEFLTAIMSPSPGTSAAGYLKHELLGQSPDAVDQLLTNATLSNADQSSLLMEAAKATHEPALRSDRIAESLVAARRLTGEEGDRYQAYLARMLLCDGKVALSQRIMTELWSSATELQSMVATNSRMQLVAVSRTVAPMLALDDLERADQLIELTALEIEIPTWKTYARLIWALAHPELLREQLDRGTFGPLSSGGVETWTSALSDLSRLSNIRLADPIGVARLIDDDTTALAFVLMQARCSSGPTRDQLLSMAGDLLHEFETPPSGDHYFFHYSNTVFTELRQFPDISSATRDQLIFASLWNAPAKFDTNRLHTVLGGLAEILALRDRALARTLLEPCFDDLGWLFMRRADIYRHEAFRAMATVDPEGCVELVDRLCEGPLLHESFTQLELRAGVIESLAEAIADRQ